MLKWLLGDANSTADNSSVVAKKEKSVDREEIFNELLVVKSKINVIKKKLDDPYIKDAKELEALLDRYMRVYEKLQEAMINIPNGLYMGIAYNLLDDDSDAKPFPSYFAWKTLHGHLGIQGSTRVGKTVLLEFISRQIIRKNENLIFVDPKAGFGQEIISTLLEEAYEQDRLNDFMYFSPAFTDMTDKINTLHGLSNESISSMITVLMEGPTTEKFFSDVVYKVVFAILNAFEAYEAFSDPTGERSQKLLAYEIVKWNKYIKSKGAFRKNISEEYNLYDKDMIYMSQVLKSLYSDKAPKKSDLFLNRSLVNFRDLAEYCSYEKIEALKTIVGGLVVSDSNLALINNEKLQDIESKKDEAIFLLNDVLSQEKDFFVKISTSLSTLLTQLSSGSMGRVFCDIRINPLYLRINDKERKFIAVIQPFPLVFQKVSMLSVKVFMSMIESLMGSVGSSGRKLNERINIVLDEAASIVYNGIETLFNQAGGLGVSLFVATQSFSDWKLKLGEDNARVIMDNLNNIIRLRMNDPGSCDTVSIEFGTKKIYNTSTMYTGGDTRFMTDVKDEWIVPPASVMRLPVARALTKNEKNIMICDLPYFSGPKGFINMPDVSIEKVRKEMVMIDKILTDNMDIDLEETNIQYLIENNTHEEGYFNAR